MFSSADGVDRGILKAHRAHLVHSGIQVIQRYSMVASILTAKRRAPISCSNEFGNSKLFYVRSPTTAASLSSQSLETSR